MKLLEQARAMEGELRALKDELHRHPELSFQEVRTTALLKEKLDGLGLERVANGYFLPKQEYAIKTYEKPDKHLCRPAFLLSKQSKKHQFAISEINLMRTNRISSSV